MKRIIALILCLITALSLFSCETGNEAQTDTAADTGNAAPAGTDGSKTVIKVGDMEIPFEEFNLQYLLTPNNLIQQYQSYYGENYIAQLIQAYGFDPTKPYDEQQCPESVYNGTFYEFFYESAKTYLTENAALCAYAKENGVELTDEEMKQIEDTAKSYTDAALQNYGSIPAAYGDTLGLTTESTIKNMLMKESLARKGQELFSEHANLTQADYDERYNADPSKYAVVNFLSYTIDSNGTSLTEEDVKKYADELASSATPEDFAAYVDNFYNNVLNAGTGEKTEYTVDSLLKKNIRYADTLPSYVWMFNEGAVGECYQAFGEDNTSCTVFMLTAAPHLNDYTSKTVRHILFNIENYTSDVECKTAADKVYREFLADPTEDNFAALANKYSDDPDVETDEAGNVTGEKAEKTSGGIYENIQRDQMVKEFEDWCFDEARQPGDSGIVKTKYGYHIMYFVGDGEKINSGTDEIKNDIMRERFEKYMEELGITVDQEYIDGMLKK